MRQIVHGHRERSTFRGQDSARREIILQRARIEGGGHHDDEQVGPALFLDVQRAGQRNVAVEMPLVEFVKDQGLNSCECRVLDQLTQQNSFGLELDARSAAGHVLKSDLVTHLTAKLHPQFVCHPRREQSRCEPPRLENHHLAVVEQTVPEQHLRHLRGLAGTGRCLQHKPSGRL